MNWKVSSLSLSGLNEFYLIPLFGKGSILHHEPQPVSFQASRYLPPETEVWGAIYDVSEGSLTPVGNGSTGLLRR